MELFIDQLSKFCIDAYFVKTVKREVYEMACKGEGFRTCLVARNHHNIILFRFHSYSLNLAKVTITVELGLKNNFQDILKSQ